MKTVVKHHHIFVMVAQSKHLVIVLGVICVDTGEQNICKQELEKLNANINRFLHPSITHKMDIWEYFERF